MQRVILAGLVACLVPHLALAGVVTHNDQASFAAATSGTTQYGISGDTMNFDSSYTQGPATFISTTVNRFNDGTYGNGVAYLEFFPSRATVTLSPSAFAIGLTLGTFGGTDMIDISINAVPVTTVTSAGPAPATFFVGFTDTDPITSLTLFDQTTSSQIDLLNFAISNTPGGGPTPLPEPASLVMLGIGALATSTLRRRLAA